MQREIKKWKNILPVLLAADQFTQKISKPVSRKIKWYFIYSALIVRGDTSIKYEPPIFSIPDRRTRYSAEDLKRIKETHKELIRSIIMYTAVMKDATISVEEAMSALSKLSCWDIRSFEMKEASNIIKEARAEIADELHRTKVEEAKQAILKRMENPWYKKFFPFRIKIERI